MTTALTIILLVVQIIVFIFFGWWAVLNVREHYRKPVETNKPTQAEAQLYFESEKYIMTLIRDAYDSGVNAEHVGSIHSKWSNKLPGYENSVHETIETITGAKYY